MTPEPDSTLLRQFVESQSDTAFAGLVTRHINLVYSVALRQVGDPNLAEEITQAVFIVLARKATQLCHGRVLSSWLFQTTRLTANNFLRTERRRQYREQEAYMQSTLNEPPNDAWPHISVHLDSAVETLGATDRRAIILRFYKGQSLQDVGSALGITEAAAEKRVSRALEKLRKFFSRKGIALSAGVIAASMATNSVHAAPVSLATKVSVVAGKGLATTTSIATLVKGTMKTLTWTKIKWAAGLGLTVALVGGATALAISETIGDTRVTVREIAQQTVDAYAALSSYSDTCTGISSGGGTTIQGTCKIQLQRPKQYRVEWASNGGLFSSKGLVWSDGRQNYQVMTAADKFDSAPAQKARDMQQTFASANGTSGNLASTVPCAFFKLPYGDSLGVFTAERAQTKRLPDEKVGDTDCYVIANILDGNQIGDMPKTPNIRVKVGGITNTLWIGKRDHLIRKATSIIGNTSIAVKWTDNMLAQQLKLQNKPVTPENLGTLRAEMEKAQAQAANGFTFTETHDNIVINQQLPPTTFTR
jgi:RNA polymerase sigma factor (sigma-70 family)